MISYSDIYVGTTLKHINSHLLIIIINMIFSFYFPVYSWLILKKNSPGFVFLFFWNIVSTARLYALIHNLYLVWRSHPLSDWLNVFGLAQSCGGCWEEKPKWNYASFGGLFFKSPSLCGQLCASHWVSVTWSHMHGVFAYTEAYDWVPGGRLWLRRLMWALPPERAVDRFLGSVADSWGGQEGLSQRKGRRWETQLRLEERLNCVLTSATCQPPALYCGLPSYPSSLPPTEGYFRNPRLFKS